MARQARSHRNDHGVTRHMARVIVHQTYAHKLKNGSVQVLEPHPDYQIVKRDIANALIVCQRGTLHETDQNYNPEPRGTE